MQTPKISVITPSFNQGRFIEETIVSVIGQGYPNLEFIIMDGGSTDETVEIIKKHESKIDFWISEKDNGQADAINKGFARASGDILCWLNSDDYYLPGTLAFVADNLNIEEEELVFGNCFHFVENQARNFGSNVTKTAAEVDLAKCDYIIQPSSFWTRRAWEKTGALNENLNYVFDWEWFLRAQKNNVKFKSVNRYLSAYRIHESHKTGTGGGSRRKEVVEVYKFYNDSSFSEACALYVELFDEVQSFIYRLKRVKPHFLRFAFLKLKYPKIFSKLTKEDFTLVRLMLQ